MANLPLSDVDYYDEVREMLGVDNTVFTDDVIDRDTVKGQAERDIKKIVTDWASLVGDNIPQLRVAVIYRICAILCTRIRMTQPISETIGDYQYKLSDTNWSDMEDEFDERMVAAVWNITTFDRTYSLAILSTPAHDDTTPTWGYI